MSKSAYDEARDDFYSRRTIVRRCIYLHSDEYDCCDDDLHDDDDADCFCD